MKHVVAGFWVLLVVATLLVTPGLRNKAISGPAQQKPEEQKKEQMNPFAGNAAAIKEGDKLFDANCAECHGDGTGLSGPDLTDDRWIYGGSDAEVFKTVTKGTKGGMPAWSGKLTDEQVWKVIAYVRSLHK